MRENSVAKAIRIIGIVEAVCGVIAGVAIMSDGDYFVAIGIALAVTSFITCMLLVGFAEVITLLQNNVDKQEEIIKHLGKRTETNREEKSVHKTVLQDIESNLPRI